ncbi:hypothetical protein [Pseudoxanthomonas sp. X-1]|uniref:hypothetical protein n=1 Tax=Pseudoxanthomonas sp. X-1 TaxID=2571115 RepID=UPI00110B4FA7|nr:hypothetical protein [Pseudoxanthomonas sp. X-1]TMN19672.1 hypothetical protein FF950_10700 [Pseudoxanthomonas sp. X-1]UAY74333.1 hypothetical protein LAJ50_18040 [Pseudoxanthomonas sp. X-1]
MDATDPGKSATIRLNLQRQHALGNTRFRAAIERQLGRRAGQDLLRAGEAAEGHCVRSGNHSDPCFS